MKKWMTARILRALLAVLTIAASTVFFYAAGWHPSDKKYQISKNFNRPLWLRSIVREPDFGHRSWYLWQMSNFRRLDGITGRVDWNVMIPPDTKKSLPLSGEPKT